MKFVFLLGGTGGFITAAATDYFSGRTPDRVLLDGAIGCLVGALLLKWFWNVLLRGVQETYIARHKAANATPAAPATPAPAPATTSAAPAARPPAPALVPAKAR